MINVNVYNQKCEKIGNVELPEDVFGIKFNADLVKQAVLAQHANSRKSIAHTKTRSDVSGGGKKPWKQKGTGRARHGSIRSPIWVGGGIAFGPRSDKDFSQKINKKQKQKAIFMALSSKIKDNEMAIFDNLSFSEVKTKTGNELIGNIAKNVLNNPTKVKMLVILPKGDTNIRLSLRNLPSVKVINADNLNIVDILDYRYTIMLKDSIDVIKNTYKKLSKDKTEKVK